MEPALNVINRALEGDSGARTFLERTTSIYVLDVTDSSKPKTYGCWNFIHQAMNEVERHEARYPDVRHERNSSQVGEGLVNHARLLASMALKVARRSPSTDKALVATCISNASHYSGSQSQSQWLIDLNLELREIVMGRIAAMAFDFSFHRKTGPHSRSAFADRVVMDTFCAILSANAISSGVPATKHFATEWIIPSSKALPCFAVVSVILHLASEGKRTAAPVGTKDMLQQLSMSVMSMILVPALSDAVSEESSDAERSQVAAMCLRAMKMWCDATDLSLPQIKHICGKVATNIVEVLSDTMYSGSQGVIDALADFIETTVQISDRKVMSQGRMNQVRHILQVDEQSFSAQFSAYQLKTIESHEMTSIVDELMSAIGLQRFRFTERQKRGDINVCRNLTRIAASVCGTWLDIDGQIREPESGVIILLLKAAGHPSVNICAMSLQVLNRFLSAMPSLANELLPTLQRKAITPHCMKNGRLSLDAHEVSGISFQEFLSFRKNVLADVLVSCWKAYGNHFMDSCTAAVEEFCSVSSSDGVSLQLEAALFCIETVADDAFSSQHSFPHHEQMKRLLTALSPKPPSLMVNHLTRERMCRFLRKYTRWCVENGGISVATDLALSSVLKSAELHSGVQNDPLAPPPSVREACLTLKEFFSSSPEHFNGEAGVASLSALWETCYAVTELPSSMTVDDRAALSSGICHVLASLPVDRRLEAFEAMASLPLGVLERMTTAAKDVDTEPLELLVILPKIGGEISILSTMSKSFATATSSRNSDGMKSGCDTSADGVALIPEAILQTLHRAWSNISFAAANWVDDETVASSITKLLSDLLPSACCDTTSVNLLRELCALATAVLKKASDSRAHFEVAFTFVDKFLSAYGNEVEKGTLAALDGSPVQEHIREPGRLLEDLILETITSVQENLGNIWTNPSEQGIGEEAFERKPSLVRKPQMKSNESLAGILSFLTKALDVCPVFLLHLPASKGKDCEDDMLLRRAVDSSVASLNDGDPELARNSISFLNTFIKHHSSSHKKLQSFVAECLTRIRPDTLCRLVQGSCGKFENTVLGDVANLFVELIRTAPPSEIEPMLVASLQKDFFVLGDLAKRTTLSILTRCGNSHQANSLSSCDLECFVQDVWRLHRVEDTEVLPLSDEVAWFLEKYSN